MASGTQGYEAAQGDIIESLVDRFKKRKKNDKKGDTSPPPNQPASISVSTPTQKMLVQGKTVQQLMPGSSALATTTGGDITQYSSENGEVLSVLVREHRQLISYYKHRINYFSVEVKVVLLLSLISKKQH